MVRKLADGPSLQLVCTDVGPGKAKFAIPIYWVMDVYVRRDALWHNTDQLFVCFGSPRKGTPASKQRMSKQIVKAIVQQWLSELIRIGVWRLQKPYCQGYPYNMCVIPGANVLVVLAMIHSRQALVSTTEWVLLFPQVLLSMTAQVHLKGIVSGYSNKVG